MTSINYLDILDIKNPKMFISKLNSVAVNQYKEYIDSYRNKFNIDLINLKNFLLCLDRAYSEDISPIRDEEYDTIHSIYEELSNGELIRGDMVSNNKLKHTYPDLKGTIRKCHYIAESEKSSESIKTHKSLEDWIRNCLTKLSPNVSHRIMFSPKFDGLSVIFEIEDGRVKSAITRGDVDLGAGNDKTNLFSKFLFGKTQYGENKYGLKCECIMRKDVFKKYNKKYGDNKFVDERSAVSGLLNSETISDKQLEYLSLRPLMVEVNGYCHPIESVDCDGKVLDEYADINHSICSDELVDLLTIKLKNLRNRIESLDVNCDGIVVRFIDKNDVMILGRDTERCVNNYERAYKFPPEESYSVLEDVVQDIGLLGKVSFTAKIKPVVMKNKTIKSISLGSKERFESLKLCKGSIVKIKYDIIPYLDNSKPVEGSEVIKVITHCPVCGNELVMNPELMCVNPNCPSRMIGKIYNYCKKVNIENIGEETVKSLFYAGILKDISSLYKLNNDEIYNRIISLDGFGKRKYNLIISSINSVKKVSDWVLFGSLGIPGISKKVFKKVFFYVPWTTIIEYIESKEINKLKDRLNNIQGIKDRTASKIIEGFIDNMELIYEIISHIKVTSESYDKGQIVFTNFRDKDFEVYLEKNGYEISESVSKSTSYVITDNKNNETSKIKKAHKYNIPVLNIKEAYSKFKYLG